MVGITVDNVSYNVHVRFNSMTRAFEIVEGSNKGTALSQKSIRDIVGTRYSYSMVIEPDAAHRADYDALFEVLSAPVDYHEVTLPYGQTTITFNAQIITGGDTYGGKGGGGELWHGLTVTFKPLGLQRTP